MLTSSYWPTYKSFELSVPKEINDCMQSFETYYKGLQTNHHKELKWNFSMGTCVLGCKIPGATKSYELIVSTYQMCILYLFNFSEKLTLDEIIEHMGFDMETAKKNMQSLANFKPARVSSHPEA